jgi:ATP-binding cassette subfamily B protein
MDLIQPVERPMSRLFSYLKPYRLRVAFATGASFLNKLLDLAPPVLVGWAVDTVNRQPPELIEWLAGNDWAMAALLLGIMGFVIFGLESLFQWFFSLGFMGLAQNVQHDLRDAAYQRMQTREMAFFEGQRVGETMSMLGDDINQLERFLNTVFNDIVQLVSLFLIAGFILFSASPGLSLIAIAPMPLIVIGALGFQKMIYPRYQKVRQAVGQLNTRLENNLGGISVIKAFNAETFEADRLRSVSAGYRDRNWHAVQLAAVFTPLIRMGVALGFAGVLWLGALWTLEGQISIGVFTLFAMMCQRILWPLTRLGQLLDETERCRASAARVFGLLDTPASITDATDAKILDTCRGEVRFHQVWFGYDRSGPILKGLDFTIQPGETVGFAGSTGAGKSTLVKLLLRFYEPTQGRIELDGKPIQSLAMASLRRQIAVVSQDVYLFHGSIRDNIAYGAVHCSDEAVQEAAKKAHLHDFVQGLPDGYATLVGERGIKLSGGQRQRLSIARALLKDAPILVLDEATSSVDTETERAIQENLANYTKGKTALIIAHRLSTIRHADRILVLKGGVVAEEGNHANLLKRAGVYADLWRLQAGETDLQPAAT